MQTRHKLPDDVKQSVISYIRGYDRRLKRYLSMRSDIINSTGCAFAEYTASHEGKQETRRQYFSHGSEVGRPVENKAEKLEALEFQPDVKKMRAVEQAKNTIGADLQSEELREKLKTAIWLNCLAGRQYPYEILDVPTIGRNEFYRRKAEFVYLIAEIEMLI